MVLLLGSVGTAAETDQFLAWGVELPDASEPINATLNREIEIALGKINRGSWRGLACEDLPPRIFRRLHPAWIQSRFRNQVKRHPGIEQFPDSSVSDREYLRSSIYRTPQFPWVFPMSRTIRVGDVYFGLDKLAHLFGCSRPYYKDYRRARGRGLGDDQALRAAVERGARREKMVLGGLGEGVVSFADLEANYQGLRLALDLCGAQPPYLERTAKGWRLARPVDLGDYITPGFDESYNGNLYLRRRWKNVEPVLLEEHCPRYRSARVQAQMRSYQRLDPGHPAQKIVADYYSRNGRDRQALQSIETVCGAVSPVSPSFRGMP